MNNLQENIKFDGCKNGASVFILATGASIKTQNLKFLQDHNSISVSNFFVHPDYKLIQPLFHVCASYCPPPHTPEAWEAWMQEMDAGTKGVTKFFPLQDRERNLSNGKFAASQVHWMDLTTNDDDMRRCDFSTSIRGGWSVSVLAIQLALYCGFKKIYLLGFDHSWILHLNVSKHFYEEKDHACVRAGVNEWQDADGLGRMKQQAQHLVDLWTQYELLSQVAQQRGAEIINATNGGILDVFPRIKYESLFL